VTVRWPRRARHEGKIVRIGRDAREQLTSANLRVVVGHPRRMPPPAAQRRGLTDQGQAGGRTNGRPPKPEPAALATATEREAAAGH
jgi:hypothetical protein